MTRHAGRLALPVDTLLEPEADEQLLLSLAAHEGRGFGLEVIELLLDYRDHLTRGVCKRGNRPFGRGHRHSSLELALEGRVPNHDHLQQRVTCERHADL